MKPLTAEEIAELRQPLIPAVLDMVWPGGASMLWRLLDEVERSRALLKRIEWLLKDQGDTKYCVVCAGNDQLGHRHGCELAALLGLA